MPNENPLQKFYYGLSDKSWAFAEWLEAKGLPLASFCDKYRLHPLLLLAVIAVVLILLVMLAAGALGGVSYGTLTVTVTSQGPLEGATVYYEFNGEVIENKTDQLGKAYIKFPKGPELALSARKEGYKTHSQAFTLEEDTGAISISLDRKVGDLVVNIDVAGGKPVPSGAYVLVESPGEVAQTKPVVNNKATFEDLPAGLTVTAYLAMGNQRIPPGGETAKIQEGSTKEITISVPESALTVSLEVRVRDATYQNLDNVDVVLYDWNTGTPISGIETTYGGSVTFNGIVLGTSVYATVNPPSAQYGSYNGKLEGHKLDVTRDGLVYEVALAIVGQVRVCVYDPSGAPLRMGTIILRRTSGASEASRSISDECEDFSGLPEGVAIYPEVNAAGYLTHANPSAAKTIDYSTITGFEVTMQPLAQDQQATVYVHVEDCEGDPIDGIKVKIIDASTLSVLDEGRTSCTGAASFVPSCGNAEARLEVGRDVYAVAFDDGYQLEKSGVETVGVNTILDIIACEVSDDNVGAVKVCAYRDGDPFDGADLELYDTGGFLRWTATTDEDEEDPDHCYTFINIPDGTTVYAKAINLGTSPEVSGTMEIVGGETGELSVYTGSAPVLLDEGDVEVCVKEAETGQTMVANVTLYDHITQRAIIAGETAGAGCRLFEGLTAETNSGGRIVPKEIYIEVAKEGYGTYNSKDDGAVLEMVPNGKLTINVNLSEAFEICVQVRASDDNRALKADVVLYYNETADYPIEKVKTGSNGVAKFYQAQRDVYYFKLLEKHTLYDPKGVYELEKDEVSGGNCGKLVLYDLGTLCNMGLEILTGSDNLSVIAGQKLELPVRVLEGGRRGDTSITDEGKTANKFQIQLKSGEEANLTLKLNNKFQSMALVYGSTKYSSEQEIIAQLSIDEAGMYSGLFQAIKNPYCSRQSPFNLKVYVEQLFVSTDSVEFKPKEERSKSFCIYVTDQDEEPVTDASVTIQVDEMDGWKSTATRKASYDEIRECYRGAIVSSMAPDEGGTYPLNILVKRGNIKKIHLAEAKILITDPCGNGKIDSGEACDPAAEPNGCSEGLICTAECKCEEPPRGSLRVSADTVKISIGSGRSAGFCVRVEDDQGVVTDAQVTANLYGSAGWPQDISLKASYDVAKGCYYVPMSESVAWPRGRHTSAIDDLMESKTIAIAAVQGDRSAATTTTASFDCDCDEERWCEWTCPCDEDCEEGGGGDFNLFNCLILLNQHGYYPQHTPYPMPYPYPMSYTARAGYPAQAYPSPGYRSGMPGYPGMQPGGVGMTPGGMTAGGISLTNRGISLAGGGAMLTLDLEACKELFGIGDDDEGVGKGYVLVKDEMGIITGNRNSGTCKELIDYLEKRPEHKFVHVESSATKDCCTKKFSGKCDTTEFTKLVNTALKEGTYVTELTLKRINQQSDLESFGLQDTYKVFPQTGGAKVLYDGNLMFGSGATFAAKARSVSVASGGGGILGSSASASAPKTSERYLWATILPTTAIHFDQLFPAWTGTTGGASGSGTLYPAGTHQSYKDIVLSQYTSGELYTAGLKSGSFLDGTEKGLERSMLTRLGPETRLFVVTDYDSLQTMDDNLLKQEAQALDKGDVKFEKVAENKMNYCHDGAFTQYQNAAPAGGGTPSPGQEMIMLRINSRLYMVGTANVGPDDICTYPHAAKPDVDHRQDLKTKPFDKFKDIAYGKSTKAGEGVKYLLLAGRQDTLTEFVTKMTGTSLPGTQTKVYVREDGGKRIYGAIRAACREGEQLCSSKKTLDTFRTAITTSDLSLPSDYEDDLKEHMITCICGGSPDEPPANVQFTIDYSRLIPDYFPAVTADDFRLYRRVGGAGGTMEGPISLPSDGITRITSEVTGHKLRFQISDVSPDTSEPNPIELYVGFEKWQSNPDGTRTVVCVRSNIVSFQRSDLRPGETYLIPTEMDINPDPDGNPATDDANPCEPHSASVGSFTITGRVTDRLGTPVAGAAVTIRTADAVSAPSVPVANPRDPSSTDANGTFTVTVRSAPSRHLYATAQLSGERKVAGPVALSGPTGSATRSTSTSSGRVWGGGSAAPSSGGSGSLTLAEPLVFDELYQLGFAGKLKDKQGKPITGARVNLVKDSGEIVGNPMTALTKADGGYKIIGKVREGTYWFKIGPELNPISPAYAAALLSNDQKLGLKVEKGKVYKLVGGATTPLSGDKKSDTIGSSVVNYMLYTLDMFADSSGSGTATTSKSIKCSNLNLDYTTKISDKLRYTLVVYCWITDPTGDEKPVNKELKVKAYLDGAPTVDLDCSIEHKTRMSTLTCNLGVPAPTDDNKHQLRVTISDAKLITGAEATKTVTVLKGGTTASGGKKVTLKYANYEDTSGVFLFLGDATEPLKVRRTTDRYAYPVYIYPTGGGFRFTQAINNLEDPYASEVFSWKTKLRFGPQYTFNYAGSTRIFTGYDSINNIMIPKAAYTSAKGGTPYTFYMETGEPVS